MNWRVWKGKEFRGSLARVAIALLVAILIIAGGSGLSSMQASGSKAEGANCQPLVSGKLYRYIDGIDACMEPMSDSQISELTDPFAMALLRKGIFPEMTQDLDKAIGEELGYSSTSYVVGEGVQIPTTVADRDQNRAIRFLLAWGPDENHAKIMMSKLAPATEMSMIEVMAFDDRTQQYNYYFLTPQVGADYDSLMAWSYNGNTPLAQKSEAMGHGCFRCHHNGVPVMRELEFPWNNWHSQRAAISSAVVPAKVASEGFFILRRNAEIFEGVVRGSLEVYYQNWLNDRIRQQGSTATVNKVDELLRHLTTSTTVNFKSSDVQSKGEETSPANQNIAGIPPKDTFLADTLFQTVLGIDYSSLAVTLPRQDYDAYLKKHNFKLVGTEGFTYHSPDAYEYPGSTYFAYYVPQVPFEDVYVTQLLLNNKIITDKFAAAILMVDFQNPLFSEKRASLQKYAEQIASGTVANGVSSIPEDFAAKIKATGAKACNANNFDSCSAEEQFLYTWELPDNQWKQMTARRLQERVNSIKNLDPNSRLDYLMRWSIQQRDRFRSTPALCEFYEVKALMPQTDLSQNVSCESTAH